MFPIVFVVTLGLVTVGFILENDVDESGDGGSDQPTRRKSTLFRMTKAVSEVPRRTVSFFTGDQGGDSDEESAEESPMTRVSSKYCLKRR